MVSAEGVAVFAETNLGTHIAMAVPPEITAGDFKKHLEKTHASCLPSFGEIQVYGLMIKRKSCFYYIPEPLPLKHIFQDFQAALFICAEVRLLNSSHAPCISDRIDGPRDRDDVSNQDSELGSSGFDTIIEGIVPMNNGSGRKIKKSLPKQVPGAGNSSSANTKSYRERITCLVSRTLESKQLHIDKEETSGSFTPNSESVLSFSVAEATEVGNHDCPVPVGHRTSFKDSKVRKYPLLSPNDHLKPTDIVKKRRKSGRVAKKLVVASNNIKMQGKKLASSSLSSICRSKIIRRLIDGDAEASPAKYLVFEIPESED